MVVWSEAIVELLRWRRERRRLAAGASLLVREAEVFLASMAGGPSPGPLRP